MMRGKHAAEVFRVYSDILRKAAALDFDDLLLRAVELLREHADVRAAWNARFHYLMVDEFQDTNRSQEELVRLLAGTRKNVCVVGDEDQSIYAWRGARAGNLKRFTYGFSGGEADPVGGKLPLDADDSGRGRGRGEKQFGPAGENSAGDFGSRRAAEIFRGAGFCRGG